jgi:hypothetical protein
MTENDKRITLSGDAALNLYLKGKDEWNKWVEENPVADIDFSGLDFCIVKNQGLAVNFELYVFPKGNVNFDNVRFGNGNVNFKGTHFCDGDVNFRGAKFGDGNVNFNHAIFGEGYVIFTDTEFGSGDVNFHEATFGDGAVSFSGATFCDGYKNFHGANFGKGIVNFSGVTFGGGTVDFNSTTFGDGNVNFERVNFSGGDVNFNNTTFGVGYVSFIGAEFGEYEVLFDFIKTKGNFNLLNLRETERVKKISFKGSSFESTFDISNNKFNCVLDLTQTDMKHHVNLSGLECSPKIKPKIKPKFYFFARIEDKEDISRLRRLKELAENNKDHERALDFHAKEMRAKRGYETDTKGALVVDYLFDFFSNYGRSVCRPTCWLILSWLSFGCIYYSQTLKYCIPKYLAFGSLCFDSLMFSASNILPFLPSSKGAREKGIQLLFSSQERMPYEMYTVMFMQGIVSFILLFFITLALRNRFRI